MRLYKENRQTFCLLFLEIIVIATEEGSLRISSNAAISLTKVCRPN